MLCKYWTPGKFVTPLTGWVRNGDERPLNKSVYDAIWQTLSPHREMEADLGRHFGREPPHFVGINVCSCKEGIISGYEIITIILLFKQTEFQRRKGIPMMKQVFSERCHLAAKLAAYEPGALVPGKNLRWAQKWSFTRASRSMTEHCCIIRGDDRVLFVLNYLNARVFMRVV